MEYNNTKVLKRPKTTGELIEYLKQFPEDTRVKKYGWDCYNDESAQYDIQPYEETMKTGKIKKVLI